MSEHISVNCVVHDTFAQLNDAGSNPAWVTKLVLASINRVLSQKRSKEVTFQETGIDIAVQLGRYQ